MQSQTVSSGVGVGHGAYGGVVDGRDKTIVVVLLEVHVHNASGPHVGHLVGEEGRDIGEFSRLDGVAAVLGEEDGNCEVGELLEIGSLVLISAGEVVGRGDSGLGVVVRRVSDWNGTVSPVLHVLLHVSDGSLDERSGVSVGRVCDDLVSGKKSKHVVVLLHHVDHRRVSLVQGLRPLRVRGRDRQFRLRKIRNHIDARVLQERHAVAVVSVGIQSIHSDDIGVQLPQVRNVSFAGGLVGQRIDKRRVGGQSSVGLVGHSSNIELGSVVRVKEFVSNNFDGWEVGGGLGHSGHGAKEGADRFPREDHDCNKRIFKFVRNVQIFSGAAIFVYLYVPFSCACQA
ncbi:hypothetical protein OGATHE_000352 [Ogataea polymorpha]|uniref:Uncharacterized protein n=1 Tax=Ogataea polymorpha TaxID=460523 RepID=A0A9P8PSQ9_9ASCO|nr:hypothetical protein OGATHE_000352 [Ogataea polymorpha]